MLDAGADTPAARPLKPIAVFGVLAFVLGLRLLHLSSAMHSPLSFQPGPDEDYYRRFGEAVASAAGADSPEFIFMDPGYGYLLGAVFKIAGVNAPLVYLLQALLDTATAFGILVAGRQLGRPRAGLFGALLYGVTSTAIMFTAAMLKETCVAFFLIWWVVGALAAYRSGRGSGWFAFGVYCGLGAALRSTLFLLCLAAMALPALRWRSARDWRLPAALLAAGVLLSLAPWSVRNFRASGSLSPFPHNGGIVLHQIYNADNPQSAIWVPPFVNYSHPSEIWRGYAAEAERRAGRSLSAAGVDAYWQEQALAFMRAHPGDVLDDIGRKSLVFLADSEVPNNRSAQEELLFSPVLAALPRPTAFLLGMGLTGLVWFGFRDRRWPLLAAPIALSAFTFTVFWAEDRFRFHAAAVLALSSGLWLDGIVVALGGLKTRRRPPSWQPVLAGVVAVSIGSLSWALGSRLPAPPIRWDHVIWGYIKMGRLPEAQAYADQAIAADPQDGPVLEALGYLAAAGHRYPEAVQDFEHAIQVRPRSYVAHFNLAKALLETGDRTRAAAEARTADDLNPSADTRALLERLGGAP